jgi:hypothetical protein
VSQYSLAKYYFTFVSLLQLSEGNPLEMECQVNAVLQQRALPVYDLAGSMPKTRFDF